MRFLVTGGTGFVGSHVVDALLARGDAVTALARDPGRLRWLEGREVRVAKGDTARGEGLDAALEGCDAVMHVAGVIRAPSEEEFRRGNAGAVRHLLEACVRAPSVPRSVTVVTSLAALGPPADGVASRPDDACRPVSAYGRSKAEAEGVCAEFAGRLPIRVVRPPIVYGPRDEAVLEIFRVVAWRLKPQALPDQRLSLVHVRDLASGILAVADRGRDGGRYFVAHPEVLTSRELANRVEEALGVLAVSVAVPGPILRTAAAVSEAVTGGRALFNRDKASEMLAPAWVCDVGGTREKIGWSAAIPHTDGLFETAAWYRSQRWL
ncbi:MAG: NAD-dependent epimerase/dehydratase family protein [Candidatus Brocadiae bacterium]|nr:NAD-dependent epimerase/dehydratase family protein [Candidatus Brocadiia bacterium]